MDDRQYLDSAKRLVEVRTAIGDGPFYIGSTTAPGLTVTERQGGPGDGIKRYTDRYIKSRRIGNTLADYAFEPTFFPLELQQAIGFTAAGAPGETAAPATKAKAGFVKTGAHGEGSAAENVDRSDLDEEDEVEDEFEELEDDDYNAEKYFDAGDDADDDADDGDEAAY